jgi:hypothetical protein
MRRLAALVGAIAMVGAAVVVRNAIDDGDNGGSNNGDGGGPVLLCATELAAACDELAREADVEIFLDPAGSTVSTLSTRADNGSDDLEYDGWLTFQRDAQIVRDARKRAALDPLIDAPSDPIARSPLVLAIWRDRAQVLAEGCGGEVTWRCLGDVAGTRWQSIGGDEAWGPVKPGHADPASTGEGLAVIGQAAAQFFDRVNLSRDDYEDDAFLEWFSRVERAVPTGGSVGDDSPFVRMLTAGPAAFDVVATSEADAGPRLAAASADRRDRVRLLYPSPVATVDVVFAPVHDRDSDLEDIVTGDAGRAALAQAGFRVDGEDPAQGVPSTPPLPDRSNLPSTGALEALLQTWREVTG